MEDQDRLMRSVQNFFHRMDMEDGGNPFEVTRGPEIVTDTGHRIQTMSVGPKKSHSPGREGRSDDENERAVAVYLQKLYRGFRDRQHAKELARHIFTDSFGENGERARFQDLSTASSAYLPLLLFILRSQENKNADADLFMRRLYSSEGDLQSMYNACELFINSIETKSRIWQVSSKRKPLFKDKDIVRLRLKRFVVLCIRALAEVWLFRLNSEDKRLLLLKTISALTEPDYVFGNELQEFVVTDGWLSVFRRMLFGIVGNVNENDRLLLEKLLFRLALCCFRTVDSMSVFSLRLCFVLQILSVPFLFKHFPSLNEKIMLHKSFLVYFGYRHENFVDLADSFLALKESDGTEMPRVGCILGNALAVAIKVLQNKSLYRWWLVEKVSELPFQLDMITVLKDTDAVAERIASMLEQEDSGGNSGEKRGHIEVLREQILRFLLLCAAERLDSFCMKLADESRRLKVVEVFKVILHFFQRSVGISIHRMEAELKRAVQSLWAFIKLCWKNKNWPVTGLSEEHGMQRSPKWVLPISIFSTLYTILLRIADRRCFYEEQVISVKDVNLLITVLKEKLCHTVQMLGPSKSEDESEVRWKMVILRQMGGVVRELEDWNRRFQYTSPESFSVSMDTKPIIKNIRMDRIVAMVSVAPFVHPFPRRFVIFRSILDGFLTRSEEVEKVDKFSLAAVKTTVLNINRNNLVEDSLEAVSHLSSEQLEGTIKVKFVNDQGEMEGEGSFKEVVEAVVQSAFNPNYGLFKESPDHSLYPHPASAKQRPHHLQDFEALGKLLGKAIFDGILVDLPFNNVFLQKFLKKESSPNDLLYLDPELREKLFSLKEYQGDLSNLGLYFVAKDESGEEIEVESGGKDKQVTNDNVDWYIAQMAKHHLETQIENQCNAFVAGLHKIIGPDNCTMFNEDELQVIISGSTEALDVKDWSARTIYSGYTKDDPVISNFWEVVQEFDGEERQRLLRFVTGVPRAPIAGFRFIKPSFTICRADEGGSDSQHHLPASLTCQNLLKLPPYGTKEVIKEKLLQAISG